MPLAVTLPLDPAAAARLGRIRQALGLPELEHPPHLTLSVLPEDAERPGLELAVFGVAVGWGTLPLVLAGLGLFPGEAPVIWAAPVPTAPLLALHAAMNASLARFGVHPHYRPGAWVPHVTLGEGRHLGDASLAWHGPIEARLERVELVAFPPPAVLRTEMLAGGVPI
jgi:2'-5' RNA ligase